MWRKTLAVSLCVGLAGSGCASVSRGAAPVSPVLARDHAALADYVQRIAAGSRVRVERSGGAVLRGTLMKATDDSILVQEHTRVPEAPIDVPLADIARVALETNSPSSVGKIVGIGVASGVAATLGVIGILAAMWSD